MIILTTCVCSLVLLQTATSVKILRNRSITTAESRHTENTQVNTKQIVQLLLTTVSNDEKPMSFLHSNISFDTLICKQTFHTPAFSTPAYWSRIFRSRIFSRPVPEAVRLRAITSSVTFLASTKWVSHFGAKQNAVGGPIISRRGSDRCF